MENQTPDIVTHAFEKAGLGRAPFRVDGFERKTYQACPGAPIQVGGSCDYCATGIVDMYYILSSDGRRFKVGSSCVAKTGDRDLISKVKQIANKVKREAKAAKDVARIALARETLESVRASLEAQPHPAIDSLTLADYVDWMLEHAGTAGRVKVARIIEAA